MKKLSNVKSNYQCKAETMSDIRYLLKIIFLYHISDHDVSFPSSSWILPPHGPTNPNLHFFPSHHKQATKKERKKVCKQTTGYQSTMLSPLNCL